MSSLFAGLVDDAAVFPPGSSPLDAAVLTHQVWRSGPISSYLGPLLVPVDRTGELLPLLTTAELPVVLIGRAGGVDDLVPAVQMLSGPGVRVVGVELPLPVDEVDAGPTVTALSPLMSGGLTVAIEVGRAHPGAVLRSLAGRPEVEDGLLRGKFRTGGVGPNQVPSSAELATVIHTAVDAGVALKFTAGLHHAIVSTGLNGTVRHGVLNLIAAVDAAARGAGRGRISAALAVPDPVVVVSQLDEARIAAVRRTFLSFGCCGVTEPLAEFARAGMIPALTAGVPGE